MIGELEVRAGELETKVLFWAADALDVFFLQVQGSGRLTFPDGTTLRAAYGAHNGQPFKSVANWLIETGRITRGETRLPGQNVTSPTLPEYMANERFHLAVESTPDNFAAFLTRSVKA